MMRAIVLTVFDDGTGPALYAGGDFITADGVSVNFIAGSSAGYIFARTVLKFVSRTVC